ncbi:MAG: hypothetical protein KKH61_20735, partial [Gammaproteobacteria bacterium]|nr:hypothetical protein [Gammaproteobacteria bacterium]
PQPGMADCHVYVAVPDSNGNYFMGDSGFDITAINLGGAVSGGRWGLIHRDKYGAWVLGEVANYGCIRGQTTAAVAAGAGTFTIDHVVTMQGICPLVDPDDDTETVTIANASGLPAANDAICIAWWDNSNTSWYGIIVADTTECP